MPRQLNGSKRTSTVSPSAPTNGFGFSGSTPDSDDDSQGYLEVADEDQLPASGALPKPLPVTAEDDVYDNTTGTGDVYGETGLPVLLAEPGATKASTTYADPSIASEGIYQDAETVGARRGSGEDSDPGSDSSGVSSLHAALLALNLSLSNPKDYSRSAVLLYRQMVSVLAPDVPEKGYRDFLQQVKAAFNAGGEDELAQNYPAYAQYIAFQKLWRRAGTDKEFTIDELSALVTWLDKLGFAFELPQAHGAHLRRMSDDELRVFSGSKKQNPTFQNPQYGQPLPPQGARMRGLAASSGEYVEVDDGRPGFDEGVELENYLTSDGRLALRPKQPRLQETKLNGRGAPTYDMGDAPVVYDFGAAPQEATTDSAEEEDVYDLGGVGGGQVSRRETTWGVPPTNAVHGLYDLAGGDQQFDTTYDVASAGRSSANGVPEAAYLAAMPGQPEIYAAEQAARLSAQGETYEAVGPAVPPRNGVQDRTYLESSFAATAAYDAAKLEAQGGLYADIPAVGDEHPQTFKIALMSAQLDSSRQGQLLSALFERLHDMVLPPTNLLQRHPRKLAGAFLLIAGAAVGAAFASSGSSSDSPATPEASCDDSAPLLELCALVVRDAGLYAVSQTGILITPTKLLALFEATKNATLIAAAFPTFAVGVIEAYQRCNATTLDELCRSPDWVETLEGLALDEDIDFFFDDNAVVVPEDGFVAIADSVDVAVAGGSVTQLIISRLRHCAVYREVDGIKLLVEPSNGSVTIPIAALDQYFLGSAEPDYFGEANYRVEVDAVSDIEGFENVSVRSDRIRRNLSFTPLADTVSHTGTVVYSGIETDFFELDTQFQLSADNERLVGRLISGPAGMTIQQQVDDEWQPVTVVGSVAAVDPTNRVRVMLQPGEHEIVVKPCVDYGVAEPACDLDSATIAFSVNYAPPNIDVFTVSPVSWVEGQQAVLADVVDTMQVSVTKGSVTAYLFSTLSDVEFVDTRNDTVLVPTDGVITIAKDDVTHYVLRATSSEFHGQASLAAQVRVTGLDESTLDSGSETIDVTVDPMLGLITQQGALNYTGVSDQMIQLNNTFTATESGETVVGRRLTGLTTDMHVEAFDGNAWQAVVINNGVALLDVLGDVRVMLPPGDHALKLFPCVDYGAAQPSCLQYGVDLSFDIAHPAPIVQYGCPDDLLFVEDGVVRCDDVYAAMNATALHAEINTLRLSNLSADLRVLDAQGQLVTHEAGTYVLPIGELDNYRLTTTLNAYGNMTYDVALGVASFNGPVSVTPVESCEFNVVPVADEVAVSGTQSHSGYHTLPHEFSVNFTVVDGEMLMGRELRNINANMTVEIQTSGDVWQQLTVVDGTAQLPATGVFRITAPEGEHAFNLVPCVDIGDGVTRCDYPPTVLSVHATAVPTASVLFNDPNLKIDEGNKIPLTQFMPSVIDATLNNITITLTDGVSLYEGTTRVDARTFTIAPEQLSQYSIGMTSVFGYGEEQSFSLQAYVTRLDGQSVVLDAVDRMFDVKPVAGGAIYNGIVSAEAFEGQPLNVTASFVLQHPEGESFAGVGISGIPDGVTVKHQLNETYVDVALIDGGAQLPLSADGRLELQFDSPSAKAFDLQLVPQTNYGADTPKTHPATDVAVTFNPLPTQVYTDTRPEILEGNTFALSTLSPTIHNGTLTDLDVTLGEGVSLYDGVIQVSERTKLVSADDISRYRIGMTSAFAYGANQTVALQAHVTRVNGQADVLDAVARRFDVTPVAGDVTYNGPVTVEKFEGQVLDLVAPFSLAHSEGESFAGVTLSGIADGVTVKQKVDGTFIDVTLGNGSTVLSLPADGRLELQLSSQATQDFTMRLVPHTNYGADAPKTDHDPVDIAVEFKAVPASVITFNDPGLAVNEGQLVALLQYAASVQDGTVTGYILTVNSGTKIFRDGGALSSSSVTVPASDVSRYSIGTPLSTDYGTKTFTLQPQVQNVRGDAVATTAEQRSVTFRPVAGSVSASGTNSVTVAEDTWQAISRTFTTQAGESVTAFKLGNVPSHMTVQYHNGNGFVNAPKSGSTYNIPVSGNQVQFRFRTSTKGDYSLTQKAVLDYGASSTVTRNLNNLSAEVNCVLLNCLTVTCSQVKQMIQTENWKGCECIRGGSNYIYPDIGGAEGQIAGCKDSACVGEGYDTRDQCSRL